jgi:hypothetical protein
LKTSSLISLLFSLTLAVYSLAQTTQGDKVDQRLVTRLEVELSAYGVESENYPSIKVVVDFLMDTSLCIKSYYNPSINGSFYRLSRADIRTIKRLLEDPEFKDLKHNYANKKTDQPVATTTVYKGQDKFVISDYGLEGTNLLKDLYGVIFRF